MLESKDNDYYNSVRTILIKNKSWPFLKIVEAIEVCKLFKVDFSTQNLSSLFKRITVLLLLTTISCSKEDPIESSCNCKEEIREKITESKVVAGVHIISTYDKLTYKTSNLTDCSWHDYIISTSPTITRTIKCY